jgi:hypothetical protein
VLRDGLSLLAYDSEVLEAALLSKHSETAYIGLSKADQGKHCRVDSLLYGKWPSIIRFMRLIQSGQVYLDYTMSVQGEKTKDHGFLWRIKPTAIRELYLEVELIDLSA